MISTSGLSPFIGITLVRENLDTFEQDVQNDPTSKKEIAAFQERIGSIETVDELVEDYEVFSFVMKAFGMEDEIYAKAMMTQIMTSDPEDSSSLVSKLSDDNYTKLNEALGFSTDGVASENFKDPVWVDEMLETYTTQRLIDNQSEENSAVGVALAFDQKWDEIDSWYNVLADEDLADFFLTAYGLSDMQDSASVDSMKAVLESRMSLEDLQDPEVREKLIRQYSAFAEPDEDTSTSAALTILSSGSSTSSFVTIDIDMVQGFSASAYL